MEALSAGVPVVTLPARISVLNLAAGQVTHSARISLGCRPLIGHRDPPTS